MQRDRKNTLNEFNQTTPTWNLDLKGKEQQIQKTPKKKKGHEKSLGDSKKYTQIPPTAKNLNKTQSYMEQ